MTSIALPLYAANVTQPVRKALNHHAHFAARFGAVYFVTIYCDKRGTNQLCHRHTAKIIFETASIYHRDQTWQLRLMLLMPDHLHTLISVDGRDSLGEIIRNFKRITAKMAGLQWQRNFFDHRIRHDESSTQKFDYIRANPVRAGFVADSDEWQFQIGPL